MIRINKQSKSFWTSVAFRKHKFWKQSFNWCFFFTFSLHKYLLQSRSRKRYLQEVSSLQKVEDTFVGNVNFRKTSEITTFSKNPFFSTFLFPHKSKIRSHWMRMPTRLLQSTRRRHQSKMHKTTRIRHLRSRQTQRYFSENKLERAKGTRW